MNALRRIAAETSAGACLGIAASLLLARWTWLEITPGMAFDTGLLMPAGALAGLVWSLFDAGSGQPPARWLAALPVATFALAWALLGFDGPAVARVPGHLLSEAIGPPGLAAGLGTALLALAMLPALLLPTRLPRNR